MSAYRVCEECGAALDPGERCDCLPTAPPLKLIQPGESVEDKQLASRMGFTKEEKLKMFSMRLDGASLQEIGDEFGVTREYIRQIIQEPERRARPRGELCGCIYPNIKAWAIRNRHPYSHIARLCGYSNTTVVWNALTGRSNPTKKVIDKILDATGMTYEEAFATEGNDAQTS